MDSVRRVDRAGALGLVLCLAACGCVERQKPGDPQQQIAAGWDAYRRSDFAPAIAFFESAAAQAPEKSGAHLQALYGLATTWNLRRPDDDPAKAQAIFQRLIGEAPEHELAAWSLLALARMKHLAPVGEEPDYDAVRQAYRECIARFPDHVAGEEAFIYLQSTFVASLAEDDARTAAAALEQFIATRPHSAFIGPAYALLAQCYATLRQPEKLLAAKIKAVETEERDPLNPIQDKALGYWTVAVIAEFEAGDFDTARKYYRLLIDEYPTDIRVYGAKAALKRMAELEAKIRGESVGDK